MSERCLAYDGVLDQCTKCDDIYFLNSAKTECFEFPKGIFGCAVYESHEKCIQCSALYFLSENTCKVLLEENKKENCLAYDDS